MSCCSRSSDERDSCELVEAYRPKFVRHKSQLQCLLECYMYLCQSERHKQQKSVTSPRLFAKGARRSLAAEMCLGQSLGRQNHHY